MGAVVFTGVLSAGHGSPNSNSLNQPHPRRFVKGRRPNSFAVRAKRHRLTGKPREIGRQAAVNRRERTMRTSARIKGARLLVEGKLPRNEGTPSLNEGELPHSQGEPPHSEGTALRDEGKPPRDQGEPPLDE